MTKAFFIVCALIQVACLIGLLLSHAWLTAAYMAVLLAGVPVLYQAATYRDPPR